MAVRIPKREMVFDRSVGKLRPIGHPPVLSSASLDWRGYLLEQHRLPWLESREVVWMNNVVVLHLNHAFNLEWKENSRYVAKRIAPGRICLFPSHVVTSARSRDVIESITFSLEPTFLSAAGYEFAGSGQYELRLQFDIEDRFIESVCLALKREVEQGGRSGKLYSESLAASLAVHLLAKYGARQSSIPAQAHGLSRRTIRQAMEFIEDRLNEDLALRDIASAVGLSPFHFARLFKQSVGLSPHQYVLKQRIERAKQLLMTGELSIAAIAVEVGFWDQSHFALHFKRFGGMTPNEFAKRCRPRKNLP